MPQVVVVILRSVLAFVALFLMTRVMGKKQVSQMTFFDYVTGITIGSIAAVLSVELEERTLPVLAGIATWTTLTVFLGWLTTKSRTLEKLVNGEPAVVIRDGKILEENLAKENLTLEDLLMLLRQKDVFHLDDVEAAFLEPNGRLSVMLKGDRQPLTGKSTGIPVPRREVPTTVVLDGTVLQDSLQIAGYTQAWLTTELEKLGIKNVKDVMLAQVDESGNLWVDLKKDQLNVQRPDAKKLIFADLLRAQAALEGFAYETEDPEAQRLFADLARETESVLRDLEPHLR